MEGKTGRKRGRQPMNQHHLPNRGEPKMKTSKIKKPEKSRNKTPKDKPSRICKERQNINDRAEDTEPAVTEQLSSDDDEEFNDQEEFHCLYCSACFEKLDDFLKHLQDHYETRPYLCDQCGFRFSRPNHFKDHLYKKKKPCSPVDLLEKISGMKMNKKTSKTSKMKKATKSPSVKIGKAHSKAFHDGATASSSKGDLSSSEFCRNYEEDKSDEEDVDVEIDDISVDDEELQSGPPGCPDNIKIAEDAKDIIWKDCRVNLGRKIEKGFKYIVKKVMLQQTGAKSCSDNTLDIQNLVKDEIAIEELNSAAISNAMLLHVVIDQFNDSTADQTAGRSISDEDAAAAAAAAVARYVENTDDNPAGIPTDQNMWNVNHNASGLVLHGDYKDRYSHKKLNEFHDVKKAVVTEILSDIVSRCEEKERITASRGLVRGTPSILDNIPLTVHSEPTAENAGKQRNAAASDQSIQKASSYENVVTRDEQLCQRRDEIASVGQTTLQMTNTGQYSLSTSQDKPQGSSQDWPSQNKGKCCRNLFADFELGITNTGKSPFRDNSGSEKEAQSDSMKYVSSLPSISSTYYSMANQVFSDASIMNLSAHRVVSTPHKLSARHLPNSDASVDGPHTQKLPNVVSPGRQHWLGMFIPEDSQRSEGTGQQLVLLSPVRCKERGQQKREIGLPSQNEDVNRHTWQVREKANRKRDCSNTLQDSNIKVATNNETEQVTHSTGNDKQPSDVQKSVSGAKQTINVCLQRPSDTKRRQAFQQLHYQPVSNRQLPTPQPVTVKHNETVSSGKKQRQPHVARNQKSVPQYKHQINKFPIQRAGFLTEQVQNSHGPQMIQSQGIMAQQTATPPRENVARYSMYRQDVMEQLGTVIQTSAHQANYSLSNLSKPSIAPNSEMWRYYANVECSAVVKNNQISDLQMHTTVPRTQMSKESRQPAHMFEHLSLTKEHKQPAFGANCSSSRTVGDCDLNWYNDGVTASAGGFLEQLNFVDATDGISNERFPAHFDEEGWKSDGKQTSEPLGTVLKQALVSSTDPMELDQSAFDPMSVTEISSMPHQGHQPLMNQVECPIIGSRSGQDTSYVSAQDMHKNNVQYDQTQDGYYGMTQFSCPSLSPTQGWHEQSFRQYAMDLPQLFDLDSQQQVIPEKLQNISAADKAQFYDSYGDSAYYCQPQEAGNARNGSSPIGDYAQQYHDQIQQNQQGNIGQPMAEQQYYPSSDNGKQQNDLIDHEQTSFGLDDLHSSATNQKHQSMDLGHPQTNAEIEKHSRFEQELQSDTADRVQHILEKDFQQNNVDNKDCMSVNRNYPGISVTYMHHQPSVGQDDRLMNAITSKGSEQDLHQDCDSDYKEQTDADRNKEQNEGKLQKQPCLTAKDDTSNERQATVTPLNVCETDETNEHQQNLVDLQGYTAGSRTTTNILGDDSTQKLETKVCDQTNQSSARRSKETKRTSTLPPVTKSWGLTALEKSSQKSNLHKKNIPLINSPHRASVRQCQYSSKLSKRQVYRRKVLCQLFGHIIGEDDKIFCADKSNSSTEDDAEVKASGPPKSVPRNICRYPYLWKKVIAILDANVIVQNLDVVQKLIDMKLPGLRGSCMNLVLPWNVLEFIDGLNLIPNPKFAGLADKARTSLKYFLDLLLKKDPMFVCQSEEDSLVEFNVTLTKNALNNRILQCALLWKLKELNSEVIILSKSKGLRQKYFRVLTTKELLVWLKVSLCSYWQPLPPIDQFFP